MQSVVHGFRYLLWLLISISVLTALSGCTPAIKKQIIEKWEKTSGIDAETIEFREDDTFEGITAVIFTMKGSYKFNKDDQLQLLSPNGETLLTAHASITNDTLTLTLSNNKSVIYRRISSNQAENPSAQNEPSRVNGNSTLADVTANIQPTTPASTHQKLSPEAEKAISEGMVTIKDPAVQACTDQKIAAIRKEQGDSESTISFDVYNEIAVNCGFNI